jgi:hypothetical protein
MKLIVWRGGDGGSGVILSHEYCIIRDVECRILKRE